MTTKLIEIRDRATMIPAIATNLSALVRDEPSRKLLGHAGIAWEANPQILLSRCGDGVGHIDPYAWSDRTFKTAHIALVTFWEDIPPRAMLDVELLLGETIGSVTMSYLPPFVHVLPRNKRVATT